MAEVTHVEEHDDGSATVNFDLTNEEAKILLNWAIKAAIKLAIQKEKNFDWGLNNEANT